MAFGAADLPVFFRTGRVVVLDGTSTRAHLDSTHERLVDPAGQTVLVRQASLQLAAGSLPTLAIGKRPTVDGVLYEVREIADEDDGLTLRVVVTPVAP